MGHTPNQVALGTVESNLREVRNALGNVAAGFAAYLKPDGTLTSDATESGARLFGISLGIDQSDTPITAVCIRGVGVPIRLADDYSPDVGGLVYIEALTGKAIENSFGGDSDPLVTKGVYARLLPDGALPEDGGLAVVAAMIDFPQGL